MTSLFGLKGHRLILTAFIAVLIVSGMGDALPGTLSRMLLKPMLCSAKGNSTRLSGSTLKPL